MTQTPRQDGLDTEHLRDYRELRRSHTDRKLAGVAAGLARHLNIDPTLLRVAFVVLCFFGGAGIVLYAALWLLVPEEGTDRAEISTSPSTRNVLLLVTAVVAACLVVGDSWGDFRFPWFLVLVLIGTGAYLTFRDRHAHRTQLPASTAAAAPDYATPSEYPSAPEYPAYRPEPAPERGPKLFWITLALVAIALGTLGLYDASHSVADAAYPAAALTVVGAMLVLGAWVGRAGGLIFLGLVAAVLLALTQAASSLSLGQITRSPATSAQLRSEYRIGAGELVLDLRGIDDLDRLDGRTVDVTGGAGRVTVLVPDGLDVAVDGEISYGGEITVGGEHQDGNDVHLQREIDGGPDAPRLDLDVQLRFGQIDVRQS